MKITNILHNVFLWHWEKQCSANYESSEKKLLFSFERLKYDFNDDDCNCSEKNRLKKKSMKNFTGN